MAVKSFKPYAPSRRFMTVASFDEITTDKPEKSLVERLQKHAGRNNQGRLTVRHQGGGHKRLYRIIDLYDISVFKRCHYHASSTKKTLSLHLSAMRLERAGARFRRDMRAI